MSKLSIKRIVKYPIKKTVDFLFNARSYFYLKKNSTRNNHSNSIIRVGFIVQMPELWDKQSDVYTKMCSDKRFEPWLIIVPHYDFVHSKIGSYGNEKDFFISNCLNGKYILTYKEDKWIEIDLSNFDYLFFQRPYDEYLPKHLRSYNTVRLSKNCYIPYCTPDTKNTGVYPVSFFRNLSFGFMEDSGAAQSNAKNFKNNCEKGIQHFLSIGYPIFEKCIKIDKKCDYLSFLWTPRWSYAPKIGGSHFMEYYQLLTNYKWNDCSLVIRPHPMMWENFIKTGIINKNKVDEILAVWNEKGIKLDSNSCIESTFQQVDVMISDRSSVIPMFFLTGKPIIYCPLIDEYSTVFSVVLPGLYIAEDWGALEKYIKMLANKEDPLLSERKKIIDNFFSSNISASDNIVNSIAKDFFGGKGDKNKHEKSYYSWSF